MLQRPMAHVKPLEAVKIMEEADNTQTDPINAVKEDATHKTTGIDAEALVVEPTVILHINVGHTECVPI